MSKPIRDRIESTVHAVMRVAQPTWRGWRLRLIAQLLDEKKREGYFQHTPDTHNERRGVK